MTRKGFWTQTPQGAIAPSPTAKIAATRLR